MKLTGKQWMKIELVIQSFCNQVGKKIPVTVSSVMCARPATDNSSNGRILYFLF